MRLGEQLRASFWPTVNWAEEFDNIATGVRGIADEALRSEQLFELAALSENLLPNRERAIELYNAAWQAGSQNQRALTRARYLCRELGRLDLVAKIAEMEYGHSRNIECCVIAGLAWLDAGKPDRAVRPLLTAQAVSPNDASISDSLKVAQKEWGNVRTEVERLQALAGEAEPDGASGHYVQAARVLAMLGTENPECQTMLRLAISANPRNDSAHALLESRLVVGQEWDELARLAERRAQASVTAYERSEIYRRWGTAFSLHYKQPERGAQLLMQSLITAYDNAVADVPGQLATYSLLREHARYIGGIEPVVALAQRAFTTPLTEDEQLAIAVHMAPAARQLAQRDAALAFIGTVCNLVPTHPLAVSFAP